MPEPMPRIPDLRGIPRPILLACGVIAVEGLALIALAIILLVKTLIDDPARLFGALGGAALALIAAAVLLGLAPHLGYCRRWARTPIVVLQALWLPVGFSLGFQAGYPEYGIPILVASLVVLISLGTPAGRAPFETQ